MNPEQEAAFEAATASLLLPAKLNILFIGVLLVILILWFGWGLVSVYKGYASGSVTEKSLISFVIRGILLILVSIYIFAS